MPAQHVVTIRGKKVKVDPGTKADIARQLFDLPEGYTVTEVSKAVPMNYSQAHSVYKKGQHQATVVQHGSKRTGKTEFKLQKPVDIRRHPSHVSLESIAKATVPTARQKAKAEKQIKAAMRGERLPATKANPKIGKLRTPGHPGDIGAGPCANCGYDLVVRKGPQYMLVHVNVTPEEHMAVTQFCMAVPESLLE